MSNHTEEELAQLTINQLREIALKETVNLSGCTRKSEIIERIIAAGGVSEKPSQVVAGGDEVRATVEGPSEALETAVKAQTAPAEPGSEVAKPRTAKARTLKSGPRRSEEIRGYVKLVMGNPPSFFEIDAAIASALEKLGVKDFEGAIEAINLARQKASDVYSHFRIYTNALGIAASESALIEAVSRGVYSNERATGIMERAMRAFVEGTPEKRDQTLKELESEALSAYGKIIGDLGKHLDTNRRKAEELKEIGADVVEPVHLLDEAEKLKTALNLQKAKEMVERASALLKRAEKARIEEIRYSIPRIRSAIEEARSIGIDVTDAEKNLKKASYLFERGDMKQCVEILNQAENIIDTRQHDHLANNAALRDGQLDKARGSVQELRPVVSELGSYGLDASEALHYMNNTLTALDHRDFINGPKFARRAREAVDRLTEELERLKKRSVHLDGKSCSQCGQEMLYDYDTGVRRCANCGNSAPRPDDAASMER